jgi:hypothetical protein
MGFSCCSEKLVAEAGGSSGNPEEEEHPPLKPLPINGSKDMTVDTGVCVTMYCKVQSRGL